jgi:hypothetical protein
MAADAELTSFLVLTRLLACICTTKAKNLPTYPPRETYLVSPAMGGA